MRALIHGLVAITLGGCFDPDSPTAGGTDSSADTSGSTGGGCPPGSSACPCYGNATCDAGLECNATVELCIPEDCAPGSESCTCNAGACLTGLECSGGVCRQPGATTDPATTEPVTTDSLTTDSVTTDSVTTDPVTTDPVTTDPATTDSVTTDPATTDPATTDPDPTTTDATDTDPGGCDGDCGTCLACLQGPGGACEAEATACVSDPECSNVLNCCSAGDPEQCVQCCFEYLIGAELYNEYTACVDASGQCADCIGQPTCPI